MAELTQETLAGYHHQRMSVVTVVEAGQGATVEMLRPGTDRF